MSNKIKCPVCFSNNVSRKVGTRSLVYKNKPYEVQNLEATICLDCDFGFITPEQRLSNESKIKMKREHL